MALKAFSRQIMFELYKTDLKFFNENFGTNKIIEEWSSDDAMVGWGGAWLGRSFRPLENDLRLTWLTKRRQPCCDHVSEMRNDGFLALILLQKLLILDLKLLELLVLEVELSLLTLVLLLQLEISV